MRQVRARFFVSTAIALCLTGSTFAADLVTRWNEDALGIIRREKVAPPIASRALAMTHLALLGAATAPNVSTRGSLRPAAGPDFQAAALACSAHAVLVALFPADKEFCDQELLSMLASIPDGDAKTRGIAAGQQIGRAIVALRADDGSSDVVAYTPGDRPGDWRPTPPANLPALLPQWAELRPFSMTSPSQFRHDGIPALTSEAYAEAFNEVKQLGAKNSTSRTADETEIARFWSDGAGSETPPGHWNTIARNVSAAKGLTLIENARLFAMLNVALADAAIVAWNSKYAYNFWRPVTAIRLADIDGNELTQADPSWEPLLTTPPFPSYTSGHSTFSGTAATVLARFFRRDDIAFETGSDGLPGVTRRFAGFWAAAEEAGQSRIFGGIHYQFDNTDALEAGRALGEWVWQSFDRPRIRR
ncbi:MAG: vanadium-dependent haloperoxidase [Acidobacteriota bacterium]